MEAKKILIIDDESAARQNLTHIVKNFCPGFKVVGDAENALKGLKQIKELNPDIVLLDIEMPGGSGFDMLDCLNQRNFEVIFITAYNQHAIKAFKYNTVDYLLKPIDIDELTQALSKAEENHNKANQNKIDYSLVFEAIENKSPTKIAIHTQNEIEYIDFSTILNFEASGNYTTVFLENNRQLFVSKTLKEFEELLSEEGFLRVHNSHLINLHHVKKYQKRDGYIAILSDGSRIPIAVRRKEIFEKLIKKITK